MRLYKQDLHVNQAIWALSHPSEHINSICAGCRRCTPDLNHLACVSTSIQPAVQFHWLPTIFCCEPLKVAFIWNTSVVCKLNVWVFRYEWPISRDAGSDAMRCESVRCRARNAHARDPVVVTYVIEIFLLLPVG